MAWCLVQIKEDEERNIKHTISGRVSVKFAEFDFEN